MTTSATAPRPCSRRSTCSTAPSSANACPATGIAEFLRFFKTIDQRTLPNLDLHLIVNNYATHKTPAVKRWLKRHARFHLRFTPTSGSWLNMVERFFAEITRKRIRRSVFKSVDELKQGIMDYLDNHNGHPKPYIWTTTASEIFSKVARAKQVLEYNTSVPLASEDSQIGVRMKSAGMGKIERIQVAPEDRERLVKLVKDRNTPQKIVWRSQIVLFAGEGIGAVEVATRVGKSVLTVRRWRRRYAAKGVDGLLKDATRPPGRKSLTARKIKQVVNLTLNDKPPDATHWSERTMAARTGIAPSSVHKIWAAHGLKPHLSKTFKSHAIQASSPRSRISSAFTSCTRQGPVLGVDEKSRIQALDRSQPGLPMKKSRCGTSRITTSERHHNLSGAQHPRQHRHRPMHAPPPASRVPPLSQDHRQRTLPNLDLHIIVDDYATHKPLR